jgi:hypothetical protein
MNESGDTVGQSTSTPLQQMPDLGSAERLLNEFRAVAGQIPLNHLAECLTHMLCVLTRRVNGCKCHILQLPEYAGHSFIVAYAADLAEHDAVVIAIHSALGTTRGVVPQNAGQESRSPVPSTNQQIVNGA